MSENVKEKKYRRVRLARSCLALLMVVVMVFGSANNVFASEYNPVVPPIVEGQRLHIREGVDGYGTSVVEELDVVSLDSSGDVYYAFVSEPGYIYNSGHYFVSDKPFNLIVHHNITGSRNEDISYTCTSVAVPGGGGYVYGAYLGGSSFETIDSVESICNITFESVASYIYRIVFEILMGVYESMDDVEVSGTLINGGGSTSPDLSGGSYNSSLGYLENMQLGMWNLLNEDDFPVDVKYKVSWDNTQPTFDDTYRVAHYVKVHSTFQMDKTKTYTSDRIFVNESAYTDCESSFVNSEDLTSTEEYQAFIAEMDEIDKNVLGTYVNEYEHNLIIYHETDDGIQYGYWNVLKLDEYGDGYVGSYLRPSYGVEDEEGNYVAKEEGDILGEFEYGQGSTFEDAEQNTETLVPEEVPGLDDISKLFDGFFGAMTGLFATVGNLPGIVGQVFTFLPPEILALIGVGITVSLILRVLGR